MSANTERQLSQPGIDAAYLHASEHRPSLQPLLAALADMDFEHESDIETIRNSSVDEWLKQTAIWKLQEHHQMRRASYVLKLTALRKRDQAVAV
jgi:hypothetical protein